MEDMEVVMVVTEVVMVVTEVVMEAMVVMAGMVEAMEDTVAMEVAITKPKEDFHISNKIHV